MGSSSCKSEQRSGSCLECSTTVGQVSIQAFGPEDGPVILALHGLSSASFIIREWDSLAESLAESGFRVLLPNFHSNSAAAPRLFGPTRVVPVLLQILQSFSPERQVVLMGKSWGGAVAAEFAAAHPAVVKQLVLVCPAIRVLKGKEAEAIRELRMPLLLLWARDDWMTWFSSSQVFCDNCPRVSLIAVQRGGHRILPDYTGYVLNFLRD
ncbi:yfhM [Symbiodinium sp. CCMP2456]|nr:yfhM [Symbiodinium sp. CCMP2456]